MQGQGELRDIDNPVFVRRREGEQEGGAEKAELDPDVWFRNVEVIAAKRIGRGTVQYVNNIYKYYTAYRLTLDELEMKRRVNEKEPGI